MDQKTSSCEIAGCGKADGLLTIGGHKICHECLDRSAPFIVAYYGAMEVVASGSADSIKAEILMLEDKPCRTVIDNAKLIRLRKELGEMEVAA